MKLDMRKEKKNKILKDAFKEFILFCRVKNLSTKTLDYYEESFEQFIKFFDENNYCKSITKETIDNYILYLKNNTNLSDVSINTRLRGLKAILYYMMRLEYIKSFHITIIKADKPVIETYTTAELKLLLEKPNLKKCKFSLYRNWVIINTFISTGMRLSSLINIQVKDLDFDNDVIYIKHMKTRKPLIMPMSTTLKKVLLEYLQYRQAKKDNEWLFCSEYGYKLTVIGLGKGLREYNRRHGVMRTGIHKFRHTFAKMYLQNGGSVFKLQKILQHKTLTMTKEYVEVFTNDLQKDFNALNPLEKIQGQKKHMDMNKRGK